ncbi:Uxu operon transcriptional regulator [Pragia fontium]|uniref:GntR family transcriptional regulator, uxuAB operon transcriptional repressor n=2 Tax=Pragia fontium TaxID=82985 RepID=A0AAJ4WA32_9GAMM|nr:Uxu operon transcriptional regulator [Pragia fontium]AKJ43074.1 transcriptional regulator [Pragia fontium]SFC67937.1 GntR family transcriptional regulator, uxuAB operon transcriptional repressor [Pragia fontium DSM 5563 = ATCC 49100]VEJ56421.1 Pyruvate dehydrogenase complex repressor [Pragia fontium]
MKQQSSQQRPYQEVGLMLRRMIAQKQYAIGKRLPPEREIAEMLNVSRTVVREALIMLEIEKLVEVRRGSGIFVINTPQDSASDASATNQCNDAGPFELLQARQLLESNIAEFAALQVTREDIVKMRQALQVEEQELVSDDKESGDMLFHLAIAEATHNSMLVELFKQSWQWRENNPMWIQLHSRLENTHYRKDWLSDHKQILATLIKRDAKAAKLAMWQHLENVKLRLLEFSDVDDINFDGYLFESWPLSEADA